MSQATLSSYQASKDLRLLRTHLILEETGELIAELARRDEAATMKELADVLYVIYGTAIAFDLPLDEGFSDVHASNMTKNTNANTRTGDRGKGEGYVPADPKKVLELYRLGDRQQG